MIGKIFVIDKYKHAHRWSSIWTCISECKPSPGSSSGAWGAIRLYWYKDLNRCSPFMWLWILLPLAVYCVFPHRLETDPSIVKRFLQRFPVRKRHVRRWTNWTQRPILPIRKRGETFFLPIGATLSSAKCMWRCCFRTRYSVTAFSPWRVIEKPSAAHWRR